jgi:hypothetical protein
MSFAYNYTRELMIESPVYNIDNPLRVDENGNQIWLYKEILEYLPNSQWRKIDCAAESAVIYFDLELSIEDKQILDDVVYRHKNNL